MDILLLLINTGRRASPSSLQPTALRLLHLRDWILRLIPPTSEPIEDESTKTLQQVLQSEVDSLVQDGTWTVVQLRNIGSQPSDDLVSKLAMAYKLKQEEYALEAAMRTPLPPPATQDWDGNTEPAAVADGYDFIAEGMNGYHLNSTSSDWPDSQVDKHITEAPAALAGNRFAPFSLSKTSTKTSLPRHAFSASRADAMGENCVGEGVEQHASKDQSSLVNH